MNEKPLVQSKRRLVRGLLHKAQKIMQTKQDELSMTAEIITEALRKGQTMTEEGTFTVAEVKERAEETALKHLGGLRQLMKIVVGEAKEGELVTEYGDDYTQRLFIKQTKTQGKDTQEDVRIFDTEDTGNLFERWQEMTPEEDRTPEQQSGMSTFIMEMIQDIEITKEDKHTILDMAAVLETEHKDNTSTTILTQETEDPTVIRI